MKEIPSDKLKVMIIWMPVLPSDDKSGAAGASQEIQDPRVAHYWSSDKTFGDLFGKVLEIDQFAWDVYLIYKNNIRWEDNEPSSPEFWMHQLGNIKNGAPKLETETLKAEIQKLTG